MKRSLETQIGGDHYKAFAIQPMEFVVRNNIPYREGCVIKYVSRHGLKNGAEDIKKAIHILEMILEDYETPLDIEVEVDDEEEDEEPSRSTLDTGKTCLEWLDTIPSPYREVALMEIRKQTGDKGLSRRYPTIKDCIDSAFLWGNSYICAISWNLLPSKLGSGEYFEVELFLNAREKLAKELLPDGWEWGLKDTSKPKMLFNMVDCKWYPSSAVPSEFKVSSSGFVAQEAQS